MRSYAVSLEAARRQYLTFTHRISVASSGSKGGGRHRQWCNTGNKNKNTLPWRRATDTAAGVYNEPGPRSQRHIDTGTHLTLGGNETKCSRRTTRGSADRHDATTDHWSGIDVRPVKRTGTATVSLDSTGEISLSAFVRLRSTWHWTHGRGAHEYS
ncbi:unnamed protein product [Danaus chrysippus]|uniref:(African queen) hypothetical protein n=1 Tax=Danaus chrysippus TaxID=151541 RepID=A0A8J2W6W4_9NEOP|nr:unnamed protein product [Danaus chrysippus]